MLYRLGALAKESGVRGLFAGLGPRMSERPNSSLSLRSQIVMTAGLVSSQFLMYGGIKKALGARPGAESLHTEEYKLTLSGIEIHKDDE